MQAVLAWDVFVKAVGWSMVSRHLYYSGCCPVCVAALAPDAPGPVIPLQLGEKQYRLNDGAFLALDGTAYYTMGVSHWQASASKAVLLR